MSRSLKFITGVAVATATLVNVAGSAHAVSTSNLARAAQPSANFESASTVIRSEFRNFHGFSQLGANLCYAAVAETVHGAFGLKKDQLATAHQGVFNMGRSYADTPDEKLTSGERAAVKYYAQMLEYEFSVDPHGLKGISPDKWTDVGEFVKKDKALLTTLLTTELNPDLDGRLVPRGMELAVSNEDLMSTIDGNGLIIVLRRSHYVVIYGYELTISTHGEDALNFKIWDSNGGIAKMEDAAVTQKDLDLVYRVTG